MLMPAPTKPFLRCLGYQSKRALYEQNFTKLEKLKYSISIIAEALKRKKYLGSYIGASFALRQFGSILFFDQKLPTRKKLTNKQIKTLTQNVQTLSYKQESIKSNNQEIRAHSHSFYKVF